LIYIQKNSDENITVRRYRADSKYSLLTPMHITCSTN